MTVYIVWMSTSAYDDKRHIIQGIFSSRKSAVKFLDAKKDKFNRLGLLNGGDNYKGVANYTSEWFDLCSKYDCDTNGAWFSVSKGYKVRD